MLKFLRAIQNFSPLLWDFGTGVFRYIQFCVLPFGLSPAPYIFTKIFKPLQKSWRSQGTPIAIFLDEGLGGRMDFVSAKDYQFSGPFSLDLCLMRNNPFGSLSK